MINLDTNIIVAAVRGSLREQEAAVLDGDAWVISDMVLAELGHLEREGRIRPTLRTREFASVLSQMSVLSIDVRVAEALRHLDFRSDPADEIIAATSVVHDIPLLTRDMRILGSKVVPLAFRD